MRAQVWTRLVGSFVPHKWIIRRFKSTCDHVSVNCSLHRIPVYTNIQVLGVFTLHGTPHDITVPMQIHIDGTNMTAKGQFTVPYVKWGLNDPSILIRKVAKEVGIDLNLVGRLSD